MMKNGAQSRFEIKAWRFAIAVVLSAGVMSGISAEKPSTPESSKKSESKDPTWSQKMRSLEQTFQALLVDVSSDELFNAPKNFKRIEENTLKLSQLAHGLKKDDPTLKDKDPTLSLVAERFSREADLAYKTLKWGHRAYARDALKSMTNYCLACHTRNANGPNFQSLEPISPLLAKLQPFEQANYFAATRQFDRALLEYEKMISDPEVLERKPFYWERAIRSSLAIAIRVKQDPVRAGAIVDRVLSATQAAFYLKEQATRWKKSIDAWKKEPSTQPQTEEGYYAKAVKLVAEAQQMQEYPADRSADVLFLRASAVVHDLMSFAPKGKHITDALYLAGLSYEVLRDLNLWDQHEFYYLACILNAPHSERSRQCYRHYEQSIYLGFTGSGGTQLPSEIKQKLNELELISRPEPAPIKP